MSLYQGLRSEFEMTCAKDFIMTLIQSEKVQFSFFFLKTYGKSTGAIQASRKLKGTIAPIATALTEPL